MAALGSPGAAATQRSRDRFRRVGLTFVASAGARLVSVFVAFVSVPLVVDRFGLEGYGLWATIASMSALLAFADLGLGNGLLNLTSAAHGHDDRRIAQHGVSSAWVMLWAVAAILLIGFLVLYPVIPWARVFNVSGLLAAAAGPAMAAFFVCFALGLPLAVAQKVQLGYQEGFANAVYVAAGSILGLCGLVVGLQIGAGLPWLVLAFAGGPVISAAANNAVLFLRRRPWLRPSIRRADRRTAVRLMRVGLLFLVLQGAVAVAFQSDVIVAARVVSPEAAAQYSIGFQLFMLVPAILAMLVLPLWPAYGEAFARGDLDWVRHTLIRSTLGTLCATAICSVALLALAPQILTVWLGAPVRLPPALLLGLAVWAVISATFNSISMLLNALGKVRFLAVIGSVMAISSIALSIQLAGRFGVAGVIWGTVIAYVLVAGVPVAVYVAMLIGRLHQEIPGGQSAGRESERRVD
jgi:O-antigen/teichoic acid export membrane protein